MKINSYLSFALLLLLVSYTLAVQTSQQETAVTQEAKGSADVDKVDPNGGGGGNWGGGGGGHGGGCSHGCCYSGYRGCQRCCSSPEEAKAVSEQAKGAADVDKQAYGGGGGNGGGGGGNWGGGGGGGGGCRFGCCGRRGYGGCQRCCSSLEEAKAFVEKKT